MIPAIRSTYFVVSFGAHRGLATGSIGLRSASSAPTIRGTAANELGPRVRPRQESFLIYFFHRFYVFHRESPLVP